MAVAAGEEPNAGSDIAADKRPSDSVDTIIVTAAGMRWDPTTQDSPLLTVLLFGIAPIADELLPHHSHTEVAVVLQLGVPVRT